MVMVGLEMSPPKRPPVADTTRHFVGDMDDVVVWTRALSDAEIGDWYTATR